MKPTSDNQLQRLHDAANNAGFQCLSIAWKGWHDSYEFRCDNGHSLTRTASAMVAKGAVCEECRVQKRLESLQQAAEKNGGKCLESAYLGNVAHRFVCAHGHQWNCKPYPIIEGRSWCGRCADAECSKRMMKKDGLARLRRAAAKHNGECLSDTYTGGNSYYRFRCSKGHEWDGQGCEIIRDVWCRDCAIAGFGTARLLADGLEFLHKHAKSNGGVCLSDSYTGVRALYRFRCKQGHEWENTGQLIREGAWCTKCAKESRQKRKLETLKRIAEERGGICLSTSYLNSRTKLHWQCHLGHRWHAVQANIRKGHWCPHCAHMNQIRDPKSKARLKYLNSPRHFFCDIGESNSAV
jgi:hypothetical protein